MSNYVIANIRIPIQVKPDGTTESLINHSIITIEKCDELPPENGNQLLMIQETVQKYLETSANNLPKKTGRNTTIKNDSNYNKLKNNNNTHRFTVKKRDADYHKGGL